MRSSLPYPNARPADAGTAASAATVASAATAASAAGTAVLAFIAGFVFPSLAFPLEVYLTVTDKLNRPLPEVSVCLQEDSVHCSRTDAAGKTAFAPATRTLGVTEDPGALKISFRGGRLSIASPSAMRARIARFDSRGRGLGPDLETDLRPGSNGLDLPGGREGLFFFRVTAPGVSITGKALSLSEARRTGHAETSGPESRFAASRPAALGKVASANLHALILSKAGYQPYTYRPRSESDTGVRIILTKDEDSGIKYAGLLKAKVTEIDSANHALRYSYAENACSGDKLITGTRSSSLPFWIVGDKWYFPAGNCQGVALTKTGEGIYGVWKTLGVEALPSGMLPKACDPEKDSLITSTVNSFFLGEGGGWDIDLRPDSMIIKLNRVACPGTLVLSNAGWDGKDGRPLTTRNTCREAVAENSAVENTGSYTFGMVKDSLRGTFTYQDKHCVAPAVPVLADLNAPDKICPELRAADFAADSAFQSCVRNTGFAP